MAEPQEGIGIFTVLPRKVFILRDSLRAKEVKMQNATKMVQRKQFVTSTYGLEIKAHFLSTDSSTQNKHRAIVKLAVKR